MAIQIRAHHLLCIQGFQGCGYNPGFVKNMEQIVERIQNENNPTMIELTKDLDEICRLCPNSNGTKCCKDPDSDERIKKLDQLVLDKLSLQNHTKNTASFFMKLSNEKIKTKEEVKAICGDCEWKEKCLWYESRE